MSHVLIVEDEAHLANGLRFNLEAEGHAVTVVRDGESALSLLLGVGMLSVKGWGVRVGARERVIGGRGSRVRAVEDWKKGVPGGGHARRAFGRHRHCRRGGGVPIADCPIP